MHPGLLSTSPPSVVRLEWVPGESWGVNRHIVWYTRPYPYPWSRSVCSLPGWWTSLQRSAPTYGKRSHIRGTLQRCAIQIQYTCTLLYMLKSEMVELGILVWFNKFVISLSTLLLKTLFHRWYVGMLSWSHWCGKLGNHGMEEVGEKSVNIVCGQGKWHVSSKLCTVVLSVFNEYKKYEN